MSWAKLIRIVRRKDGRVRVFIGDQDLSFVRFAEDYSREGHTVTLTVPADHVLWEEENL